MNIFSTQISGSVSLSILEIRHAPLLFDLVRANHSRLLEWCPWLAEVETIEQTEGFVRSKLTRFANDNGFTAGLFENSNLIGVAALEYIDAPNSITEIGYWLDEPSEGRGIITAVCRRLIDHAFTDRNLERVQIRCATDNLRSRAIPQKLGFTEEGVIRQCERLQDRTVDLVVYGLLRSEWNT